MGKFESFWGIVEVENLKLFKLEGIENILGIYSLESLKNLVKSLLNWNHWNFLPDWIISRIFQLLGNNFRNRS